MAHPIPCELMTVQYSRSTKKHSTSWLPMHQLQVLAEMMDADAAAHRARIVSWLGLASEGDWAPAEAVLSAALGVDKSAGSSGAAEAPPAAAALDDSSELALAENAAKLQDSAPAAADAAAGGVSGSRGGGSGAAARRGRVRAAVAALAAEAAARSSASANASKSAGPSTVQSYGGAGLGDAESYQPSSAGDVFSRLHERLAAAASPPAASASSAAAAAASAPDSVPNDGASRRAGAAGAGAGVEAGASLSPSSDSLADCMGVLEFSFGSGKPLRPKPKLRARAPARAATIASATATTAAAGSGSATAGALASAGNAAGTSGKAPVIVQYDDDVDSDFNTSVEASQRPLEAGAAGADRLLAELSALASRLEGAARLRREKPSTAAVGTSGIVAAIHALSARHGGRFAGVQAYKLVGKACRGAARPREIVVAPGDTEKEVECQWAALRSAFGRPGSALVLHLKNHYALVYACREWVEAPAAGGNAGGYNAAASSASGGGSGGASSGSSGASTAGGGASGGLGSSSNIGGGGGHQRREVLTARRGQRPSAWVSWEELRALFVKWEGYGIVAVSLKTGDSLN